MARPPEKVFWSEEEKLAIVMRAIELRLHKMWTPRFRYFELS
jgi:hypothetical protein